VKRKKTSDDATKVSVSLAPRVELALQAIRTHRREHQLERITRNEIIEDAIWMLADALGIHRDKLEAAMPSKPEEPKKPNVTPIRKKRDKIDS
jgi:hypothetical protein